MQIPRARVASPRDVSKSHAGNLHGVAELDLRFLPSSPYVKAVSNGAAASTSTSPLATASRPRDMETAGDSECSAGLSGVGSGVHRWRSPGEAQSSPRQGGSSTSRDAVLRAHSRASSRSAGRASNCSQSPLVAGNVGRTQRAGTQFGVGGKKQKGHKIGHTCIWGLCQCSSSQLAFG